MSKTKTTDDRLSELDALIADATATVEIANREYHAVGPVAPIAPSAQRGGFDPGRRLAKVRAGLRVNACMVALEDLKAERATLRLAAATDPEKRASLEAAATAAAAIVHDAEAEARRARSAYGAARSALDSMDDVARQAQTDLADAEYRGHAARKSSEREGAELRQLEAIASTRAGATVG